jgi:hypothetical protein
MNRHISIKNIIATKMGQNDPVVDQILHFGPSPLEKISKRGAKKGGKPTFTKSTL